MYLLWILAAVILLAVLAIVTVFLQRKVVINFKLPYLTRASLFNRSEAAFFLELKKQLPEGLYVFPKVRMIDFLEIDHAANRNPSWLHKIWAKHVDFLICDRDFKPVLAIEVNGSSHNSIQRIQRDVFVQTVYTAANLPLEIVNVGTEFSGAIRPIVTKITAREMHTS